MGSTSSEQAQLFNWRQIQKNRYQNLLTHQIIDHELVQLSCECECYTKQNVIDSYRNRIKIDAKPIVKLLYFCNSGNNGTICNQKKRGIDVYIQGGLTRLTNMFNFKLNKCMCSDVILGFQHLKNVYGPFQVNSSMIFKNTEGQIKVWLNQNPFLNTIRLAKQSLMVLQIKQSLIKLGCNCNLYQNEDLSFDFLTLNRIKLKKKRENNVQIQNIKYQQFSSKMCVSNTPMNNYSKNIFYNLISVKNQKKSVQNINISQHLHNKNQYKPQNLSYTLKIERDSKNSNNIFKAKQKIEQEYFQHKKYSSQKVNFKFLNSLQGTTNKIQHNQTELTSKCQSEKIRNINANDNKFVQYEKPWQLPKNRQSITKVIFSNKLTPALDSSYLKNNEMQQQINKIMQIKCSEATRQISKLNIIKEPRQSQGIQTMPFDLCHQDKLIKISSAPQNPYQIINLPEVKELQHSSQLSLQELNNYKKQMTYQNSYTERSKNGNKIFSPNKKKYNQCQFHQIQYQIPQKTKVVIKKYISQEQGNGQKSIKNLNKSSQMILKAKLSEKNIQKQKIKLQKTISNHIKQTQQKKQKEVIKKQMEKLFHFSPASQQETKIRKKVEQKKAIFADLKAEASKILDGNST